MASILKVDQINDRTNNNKALEVDSSGRVLQPEKPAFFAYMDSSVAEGFTGTIVCNNVRYNKGGHYSTSTGKFTAPVAGVYQFNFVSFGCENASGAQLVANTSVWVDLHHDTDGTDLARVYHVSASSGYPNLNISHAVHLDANDEIKIQVNNRYIYNDSSDLYITFSGVLIG
jgi:hypothetical protein